MDNTNELKQCLGFIDLTTLNATDTPQRAQTFAHNVNRFAQTYPQLPCVAAICVYPMLVADVKEALTVPSVKVAATGAGFPASQTFEDVKALECALCVDYGADEVDIVISLNHFLSGNYDAVAHEIDCIRMVMDKAAADRNTTAHLKVILETGALKTEEAIRKASFIAMEHGADFIKTSTGKSEPAATPFAAEVMCHCIKEFYQNTGKKVGFKPAGGIVASADALAYRSIVQRILGDEWLTPSLFRIGASRLANHLLSDILRQEVVFF